MLSRTLPRLIVRFLFALTALTFAFGPGSLQAQTEDPKPVDTPEQKPTPTGEPKPEDQGWVENWLDGLSLNALVRLRTEFKRNWDFSKSNLVTDPVTGVKTQQEAAKSYTGMKTQFGVDKKFSDDVELRITFQDSRVLGGQPGSRTGFGTANDSTDEKTDVRAAWIDAKNLLGPISIRAGRQILKYGDERLVGAAEYTNVGRSFDGFLFKYDSSIFTSHAWAMSLAEKDSDANANTVRTGASNSSGFTFRCDPTTAVCTISAATTRELNDAYFGGWYNTWKPSQFFLADFYYLGVFKSWVQQSSPAAGSPPSAVVTTQDRQRQRDNLHTFGLRLTDRTSSTNKATVPFDWTVEYARQFGQTGQQTGALWDPVQATVQRADALGRPLTSGGVAVTERIYKEKQRYDAYAYAVDVGWTFDKLRLGAEYDVASGDNNRNDSSSKTFQNLFPTNHKFYGEADQISWQNMKARSGSVSYDFEKFGKLRLAYWEMDKMALQDAWYDVGGNRRLDATGSALSTESQADARYANAVDASGNVTSRAAAGLKKHLFKEYDIVYTVKVRRIELTIGYSQIIAGDSIADVKNDVLTPIGRSRPDFAPRAQYAYFQFQASF